MRWELAAIPCSHVFIPMFAGWLSTGARKLRDIILCRKLPALGWQDAANVHRWGMMTCGERRMAAPFFRRGMRTAKYAAELSSSPSRPPGPLCVSTVLLCAARVGFAFAIWWFSKSPRTSSFWCKKNFKYMFDCFDSFRGKKKPLLCLCFLHRKALACNASELRFRLAYFNF